MNKPPRVQTQYAEPPLCPMDRLLYAVAIAGSGALLVLLSLTHSSLRSKIAFSDPTVIASSETASYFLLTVSFISLLMIAIFSLVFRSANYPLIGRSDCRYLEQLPIIRSRPQDSEAPAFARRDRTLSRWLFGILILGALTAPLSLSGRVCLHEDGSISGYNAFNQQMYRHDSEDVYLLTIGTCKLGKYKSAAYDPSVRLEFYLAGHGLDPFTFYLNHFRRDTDAEPDSRLTGMLTFKRCFPKEIIRYDNVLPAREVTEYYRFSQQERQTLSELIGIQ